MDVQARRVKDPGPKSLAELEVNLWPIPDALLRSVCKPKAIRRKMKTPKINDLSIKMNHLQVQKMAPSQASELKALALPKKRAARLGELARSCKTSMIKLPCNLHINGVAASTSGNASRGNQDSWRRIVSLADGIEHIMLGKYLSKSRTGDQKGASESGSSYESSLLTGKYNQGKIRLPLGFGVSLVVL